MPVFILADHIVSPLGEGTAANFRQVTAGVSGIRRHEAGPVSARPFYASLFEAAEPTAPLTRFETILISAIDGALKDSNIDPSDPETVLILSTTKGNIQLLETNPYNDALRDRISLSTSARLVAEYFGFTTKPIVVSNACISGVLAITTGARLLRAGKYKHAVIVGGDIVSRFILSGFESFQAVSPEPCRPFDAARSGITLGEGAAAMVLSTRPAHIEVLGGSIGNDANHISGPSRTGQELAHVIRQALGTERIDFISAHGTATPYNDEMEAKAVTLAGLGSVPIHSLKGYYGHTFGAAGLIESILSVQSLREDCLIPSMGFEHLGVSEPIHVIQDVIRTPLQYCLKTASGFGGCNAAVVFGKSAAV